MFGLRPLPFLLAVIAFYLTGFVWFGLLFSDLWMKETGFTESDFEGQSPAWMAIGPVISFVTVLGIGKVLKWTGTTDLPDAMTKTLFLWLTFGVTAAAYDLVYDAQHSVPLFLIDASHFLVGWLLATVILIRMKA